MKISELFNNAQKKLIIKQEQFTKNIINVESRLEKEQEKPFSTFAKNYSKKSIKEETHKIDKKSRKDIPADTIDFMQQIEASEKYKNKIYKKFYSGYPEMPFISKDREVNTNWIEETIRWYEMIGKAKWISKEIMTRYSDGLLPGHVYMLYWLKKYTNKKIPAYFEYKYGINFEKEKGFLFDNEFLNSDYKPTEKGELAIQTHYDIIESHKPPKPDRSIEGITKQIIEQRDNMLKNGNEEYKFLTLNPMGACEVCKALDGKHFKTKDMMPGVNAPPMHDGCHCCISPYKDYSELDALLDFIDKGGTEKEWNKLKKSK